jgi:hypothetical protein
MTGRSSLKMLAAGLLVGAALGYAVGRRPAPAPPAASDSIAVAPGPVDPSESWPFVARDGLFDTKPAGVSKGMSRAQATAALRAEGFDAWTDASVSDPWERFRKPWMGGYHFVNLRFGGEEVAEVGELWNDP